VNTAAIIEARMTSTRLPGKVLKPILGRPTLELLVERLRRVQRLDQVIVATTVNATDDPIEALAKRIGAGCFRGSEADVLERVLQAARAHGVGLIVEITGDCPLADPATIDRVLDAYHAGQCDYASNVLQRTYPRGLDVQVFPTAVLEDVARRTADPVDHEHVSLYIYSHPERYRLRDVVSGLDPRHAELRLTVDTPEDFALIGAIYEALYPGKPAFGLGDILALLDQRPELARLNQHIQQKQVRQ
jgi:spore coat polysaccharide biosynthesis protein SpsF